MKRALFTGTFDPPTLGHVDIIHRASQLADELYVGIGENLSKPIPSFSRKERRHMLTEVAKELSNVHIVSFSGLVIDLVFQYHITFIVRALRLPTDFDKEFQMAIMNKKLSNVDTIALMADPKFMHLSSSLIREIAAHGHRLHGMVPESFEEFIFGRLQSLQKLEV